VPLQATGQRLGKEGRSKRNAADTISLFENVFERDFGKYEWIVQLGLTSFYLPFQVTVKKHNSC